jgi:hypothetical protein
MIFNTSESGSSIAYFSNSVSATGYITRTDVFDKSKSVSALDYMKDADDYLTTDGKVNHTAFEYSAVSYDVTDFSKPVVTEKEREECETNAETQEEVCKIIKYNETTYPYKMKEEGVDLVKETSLLKQATFEVKEILINILNRLNGAETKIEDIETNILTIESEIFQRDIIIYEQNQTINNLKTENTLIKQELCKMGSKASWCLGGVEI